MKELLKSLFKLVFALLILVIVWTLIFETPQKTTAREAYLEDLSLSYKIENFWEKPSKITYITRGLGLVKTSVLWHLEDAGLINLNLE